MRATCKTGNYEQALAYCALHFEAPLRELKDMKRSLCAKNPWLSMARRMCKRARENAIQKGRKYDLTPELVLSRMLDQNFRCAVTDIELQLPTKLRDPWAPSLDQIIPGAGYTPDNVRIVSMIVNTAMNGWGEQYLLELIKRARVLHT